MFRINLDVVQEFDLKVSTKSPNSAFASLDTRSSVARLSIATLVMDHGLWLWSRIAAPPKDRDAAAMHDTS
jgi:hypothetical protein